MEMDKIPIKRFRLLCCADELLPDSSFLWIWQIIRSSAGAAAAAAGGYRVPSNPFARRLMNFDAIKC